MSSSSLSKTLTPLPPSRPAGHVQCMEQSSNIAQHRRGVAKVQTVSCDEDISYEVLSVFDTCSSGKVSKGVVGFESSLKKTARPKKKTETKEGNTVNFSPSNLSRREHENDNTPRSNFSLTHRKRCSYQKIRLTQPSLKHAANDRTKQEANSQSMSSGLSSYSQNIPACEKGKKSDSFQNEANFVTPREAERNFSYALGVSSTQPNNHVHFVSLLYGTTSTNLSSVLESSDSPTSSTDFTPSCCSTFDAPENILFPNL
mmetsp:Transcript_20627/g.30297  ORF Transcript_20627/g.30297 Transcript_20627/m.30297 type:complete len:258 (-) Transcript_20627:60-833(-)